MRVFSQQVEPSFTSPLLAGVCVSPKQLGGGGGGETGKQRKNKSMRHAAESVKKRCLCHKPHHGGGSRNERLMGDPSHMAYVFLGRRRPRQLYKKRTREEVTVQVKIDQDEACVCVRVVGRTTLDRSSNMLLYRENTVLTCSPPAPSLAEEPWMDEASAAPPEDAFSLLGASLLLSVNTRASSCCRASCGAHRTNTGAVSLVHEQQEMENAAFQRRVDSCSLVSCATR